MRPSDSYGIRLESPMPLALLAVLACARTDAPTTGAGATIPTGVTLVAAESLTVPLPRMAEIGRSTPEWVRTLDDLSLPDGRLWSAYSPAGLAAISERVLVADEANHELLALDAAGRVVALAGGLGQGAGELYSPGDAVSLGDQAVVADRANARLAAFALPGVSESSRLPLPGPPVRLSYANGALYALTIVPRAGLRLLRIVGCCVSPAVDTVALLPPVRTIPRGMAVLADGRLALLSGAGDVSLYRADGALTRVVHFADEPQRAPAADSVSPFGPPTPARIAVGVASLGSGPTILITFGDAVGCFDVESNTLSGLWQPPVDDRGRLATVSLLAASDSAVYAYQPASHTLARYPRRC